MNKSNIYASGDKRKINQNWFTDKVHMKDVSSKIRSKEQLIYHVYFNKGAKTKLHQHNGSQVLIVTEGKGSLELFRKYGESKSQFNIRKTQRISLKLGDSVYIPAGVLHTHGSVDKKQTFSHIAINILPRKNAEFKTIWYESDFRKYVTGIVK